jgi:hypothetical protein
MEGNTFKPWRMKGWHTICETHRDKELKKEKEIESHYATMYYSEFLLLSSVVLPVRAFNNTFRMDKYVPYFASQLKYASGHFKRMNSPESLQSTMKKAVLTHAVLKEACNKYKNIVALYAANHEVVTRSVSELMEAQNDFQRQILTLMKKTAYNNMESELKAIKNLHLDTLRRDFEAFRLRTEDNQFDLLRKIEELKAHIRRIDPMHRTRASPGIATTTKPNTQRDRTAAVPRERPLVPRDVSAVPTQGVHKTKKGVLEVVPNRPPKAAQAPAKMKDTHPSSSDEASGHTTVHHDSSSTSSASLFV